MSSTRRRECQVLEVARGGRKEQWNERTTWRHCKRVHETCESNEAMVKERDNGQRRSMRDKRQSVQVDVDTGCVSCKHSKTIVPLGSAMVRKFCWSDKTNFFKITQSQTKTLLFSFGFWWKRQVFWKTFVLLYYFDFSTWTSKTLKHAVRANRWTENK